MKIEAKTLFEIHSTTQFRKQLKKIQKQGKNLTKLENIIKKLATKKNQKRNIKNHMLNNSKYYKNCGECHIEPDWLLVYQYNNNKLILLLVATGTHSEIF